MSRYLSLCVPVCVVLRQEQQEQEAADSMTSPAYLEAAARRERILQERRERGAALGQDRVLAAKQRVR